MTAPGTAHLREGALLGVEHLTVEFPAGRGRRVHAVSDFSIDVMEGETLGVVGESGCGKSTTGRAIMQLPKPTGGSVRFEGTEVTTLSRPALRQLRPRLQMIFQDPISSLNPRRKVEDIVAEGLDIWKIGTKEERSKKVDDLLVFYRAALAKYGMYDKAAPAVGGSTAVTFSRDGDSVTLTATPADDGGTGDDGGFTLQPPVQAPQPVQQGPQTTTGAS